MLSFEEVKIRLSYPILDVVLDESQYNLIVKSAKQQAEIYKDKLILELASDTVDIILNRHYDKINSLNCKD